MNHQQKNTKANTITAQINSFHQNIHSIPAAAFPIEIDVLSRQLVDSICRVEYFQKIQTRPISHFRTDPTHVLFDPIRAIFFYKKHNIDEAFWLAFLMIHFGENYHSKWKLTRAFYGNLGQSTKLTWANVSQNPNLVDSWVNNIQNSGIKLKFGNHRKYESFNHLKDVISRYIQIINSNGGHNQLFSPHQNESPKEHFQRLYQDLKFYKFGRLGMFDYLSLIYKTQLANIQADSCHINGSTGPKAGAKRLFGNIPTTELEELSIGLADYLNIGYQEFEDAICNWQKSPHMYQSYTG
ncbi:hypothetical protein F966_01385 [Acinetobacter higginsii]|uniref:Alpha-glutamyl/putrescinyl thymine pyrophosphorylase clade 3 domain-containing protein n=1 Tax=Acinetobacter higginsii TaxID=70347 RepID=N8WDM8_9GAMM|nr:hypothetical protein [Acinetobacter higginsii]ENV10212.1 hypothetical protein F966_01385 [Acinetobacter higginsii]